MNELANKRALVLGVDAIGAGIAKRFARAGAALALLGSDLAEAESAAQAIAAGGGRAFAGATPIDGSTGTAIARAIEQLGGLDVLVVNVLPAPVVAPLERLSAEVFATAFARVQVAVAAMQIALPHLRSAGGGRIILVGHRYGENVNEAIAAYNAAAWSLVGLTRSAAVDWGQYQIATNLLLPLADTPEFRACQARRAKLLDLMTGQLPLGRVGDPVEDVGAAALFLASDACNFVNGEVIHGDGGQHVAGPLLNPARFA